MRQCIFLLLFGCVFSSGLCQTDLDSIILKLAQVEDNQVKLSLLDSLTTQMVKSSDSRKRVYLKKYIKTSIEFNEVDNAVQKSRFLIQDYLWTNQIDSARIMIDSMYNLRARFKKEKTLAHLLLKRAAYHFYQGSYALAVADYSATIQPFFRSNDSIFAADAYYFRGQAHFLNNEIIKSLNDHEIAERLYDVLGDEDYAGYVGLELANLLGSNGLDNEALKKRKDLIAYAKKNKSYCLLINAENQLLNHNKYTLTYSQLLQKVEEIKALYKNCNDRIILDIADFYLLNIQLSYFVANDYEDEATETFENLQNIVLNDNDFFKRTYSIKSISSYYLYKNEPAKALSYINSLKNNKDQEFSPEEELHIWEELSIVHQRSGDLKKANLYLQKAKSRQDSLHTLAIKNSYSYYQSKFDLEKRERALLESENDVKALEQEKREEESNFRITVLFFTVIILLIILIASIIIIRFNKKSQKLANELQSKKDHLKDLAHRMITQNIEKEQVQKELQDLKNKSTLNNVEESEPIVDISETKILTSEDWKTFRKKFKETYPLFFQELKKLDHDFTNGEERLLVLEKLKLSNWEIANILAISIKSVNTARYRLRKKISLSKDDKLEDYIDRHTTG